MNIVKAINDTYKPAVRVAGSNSNNTINNSLTGRSHEIIATFFFRIGTASRAIEKALRFKSLLSAVYANNKINSAVIVSMLQLLFMN